jgi:secreted trypsin-like serine protease
MRKGTVCMISKNPSKYNLIDPVNLTERMILAAKYNNYPNPYDNVSICQGDSGGPLLHVSNGKYQLIGLVSFTVNGCGVTGYPGGFTYVNYFRYWIKENTKLCYIK